MRTLLASTLAGLALLSLLGCGDDDDTVAADDTRDAGEDADDQGEDQAPGGGVGIGALAGRTFLSETITEDGQHYSLVDGTQIELTFAEDGTIGAVAGCNRLGGLVEVLGTRLVVENLGGTDMACDPALQAQDDWLVGILSAGPTFTLDGAELQLQAGGTVIDLTDREVADPDRTLEGTEWQLDGLVDGDAVSSVPGGAGATLTFADRQVAVTIEGCNSGSAPVQAGDGTLQVGPMILTRMACMSPAAEVEAAVVAVLEGEVAYAIDAATLTLGHPSGKGLTLRATA